nr:heme exporter protein CcmD [Pseudoxanthomonas broegbernensis]
MPYVIGAYAVFVLVFLWDFLAPRLQVRRELRAVRLRASRERKPAGDAGRAAELSR